MGENRERTLTSVVIPTFNRRTLVLDALESVRDQTVRPLEVIVVDDGSTDGSEPAILAWAKEHGSADFTVRCVVQENSGGNAARNRGIRESSGPLVAFLDSDDKWAPCKLERQVAALRNNPKAGAVYCGVRHIDLDSGEVKAPTGRRYPEGNILEQLLVRDVTAPTSAYLIKREVFEKVGEFDEALEARQDWDMWIRIASDYEVACVPEPLVEFREHGGVRTASDPTKEIRAYKQIMKKYARIRRSQSWKVRRLAEAAYLKRMGRVHFHRNISTRESIGYYFRSLFSWPFDFDTWAALGGVILPHGMRGKLHRAWNRVFGRTRLAIRSH